MYLLIGLLSTFVFFIIGRLFILVLYFFTEWFTGVFDTMIWPILGFIFMPATLLWYSAVVNWYAGYWGPLQVGVMVAAVIFDLWVAAD